MKTVIVDDEIDAIESLELIIEELLPQLEITNVFSDPERALKKLPLIKPDIVFLDISMPVLSGFDLLRQLGNFNFDVIFTTAHDEFALKAFKFGAASYLLKPINFEELKQAVFRISERRNSIAVPKIQNTKIAINSIDGIHYLLTSEIVYISWENSNTKINLKTGRSINTKKSLKDFENILPDNFCRIHNSHIVNTLSIKKLIKSDIWFIELEDGPMLSVSRRKKTELKELIDRYVDISLE